MMPCSMAKATCSVFQVTELIVVNKRSEARVHQITCLGGREVWTEWLPFPQSLAQATFLLFHKIEGSWFLHHREMRTTVGHDKFILFGNGDSTDFYFALKDFRLIGPQISVWIHSSWAMVSNISLKVTSCNKYRQTSKHSSMHHWGCHVPFKEKVCGFRAGEI